MEWLRNCYQSEWSFWPEAPELRVKGRYYFTPQPVRFAEVMTPFGSRYWTRGDHYAEHGLGEVELHARPHDTGRPPLRVPLPVLRGDVLELAGGCPGSTAAAEGGYLVDGFDRRCFPVPPPFVPTSPLDLDPTNPAIVLVVGAIIDWLYNDPDAIAAFFALWFGGAVTVTTVPNSASLIPGSVVIVHPNWTLVVVSGTSNPQQMAVQAAQSLRGPVDLGPFGTLPLWFQASNAILARVTASGANPNNPILFAGHSYGGVVAALAAARVSIANPQRTVSLLTFGMPAPGDERLCAALRPVRSWHFSTQDDPVPQLPLQGAYLYGLQFLLPPGVLQGWLDWCYPPPRFILDGEPGYRPLPVQRLTTIVARQIVLNLIANRPIGSFPQHSWGTYYSLLRAMLPGPIAWPLAPPIKAAVKPSPTSSILFQCFHALWGEGLGLTMVTYPDLAYVELAEALQVFLDGNCELGLFVNNPDIDPDTAFGDLTEATFGGYVRVTGLTFPNVLLVASQTTRTKMADQTFTCDGTGPAETVFGAFLLFPSGQLGAVLALETPKDMILNGDVLNVQLAQFFGARGDV